MGNYRSLEELVALIDEPNRSVCGRILADHRRLFQVVPGSSHNHQAWPGGYLDHVVEAMNIAAVLYPTLRALRPLPFSLSDALLVAFLHDIEKPWKYELSPEGGIQVIESLRDKAAQKAFRERKLVEYGISLTPDQANGLAYVEGEHKDYSNQRRVMGPLATFVHLCDVTSARIWFDQPSDPDPWPGATRQRD